MAAPGRKPLPTNIIKLKGTSQAKLRERQQRKDADPSKLDVIKPVMPANLSDDAKRAWTMLVPRVESLRVVTNADIPALVRMCECHADIVAAEREVRANGYSFWSENEETGVRTLKLNPAVNTKRAAEVLFKNYLVEFGMTPSARARVRPGADSGEGGGDGGAESLLD